MAHEWKKTPAARKLYAHDDGNDRGWMCFPANGAWYAGWTVGTILFILLLSFTAFGIALWAQATAGYDLDVREHFAAGPLPNHPFTHAIVGAAPLTMTLPNDLSDFKGRTFHVYATSAHPHKITIQPGLLGTSWDGGAAKDATFGGAILDGLQFTVIDKDKIAVESSKNVVFS